jgi:Xaa-Pro aminopeptidase
VSDAPAVLARAVEAIKPGMTVAEVHNLIAEHAKQPGFELLADYGVGNGVGLSLNELPVVSVKGAQRLKEGMCLAVRLPVRDKTYGKVMFGSTIIVGKNGAEPVT